MARKSIGKTQQVNWKLPADLYEQFNTFYGTNKSKMGFTDPRDAAVFLLDLGISIFKADKEKKTKSQ